MLGFVLILLIVLYKCFKFHLFHAQNLEQLHNLFLSLLGNVPHIDQLVTDSTQALNSPYNDPEFCFWNFFDVAKLAIIHPPENLAKFGYRKI